MTARRDGTGGARLSRVQNLAKRVLGELLQDLKDPRVGFATVTKIRVSPDLQHAHVLVSVLGSDEEQNATMDALERARPHLRTELGRQMRLRYVPELRFELDRGPEEAERIEYLLRKIQSEEQRSSDGAETGDVTAAPGSAGFDEGHTSVSDTPGVARDAGKLGEGEDRS